MDEIDIQGARAFVHGDDKTYPSGLQPTAVRTLVESIKEYGYIYDYDPVFIAAAKELGVEVYDGSAEDS